MIFEIFNDLRRRFGLFIILLFIIIFSLLSINYYNNYKEKELENFEKILTNIYFQKFVKSTIENLEPRYIVINYDVVKGDSFNKIIENIKLPLKERKKLLNIITKKKNFYKLNEGQTLKFTIDKKSPEKIIKFSFSINKTKEVIFTRNEKNSFDYKEIEKNLKKQLTYKESIITNSLYSSAMNNKISPNIIIDFARIYGFQVDFQRDIWKNDSFQIIYENYLNKKNEVVDTGNILYANLILQGKELPLYFFKTKKFTDHFDENGQSIKKTLMKTPINGARLSSSFGMRKHPILGFNKMHQGTDFAAPKGTPIMASGDGKIIKAGWCGGGGNCVKIRHNSNYSTVYAHMSKFGRGIKKNARVKQGQIIGYVGSTGMSTGPHLHYEVIFNGKKVNSQKLKLPSGRLLKGKNRENFEIIKIKTNVLKSKLILNSN